MTRRSKWLWQLRLDLAKRLAKTGDSEPEQAIKIRLSLGLGLLCYFCLPWQSGLTFTEHLQTIPSLITLAYYTAALAIAGALILNPVPSPTRRISGIFLDLVSLSLVMYLDGEKSVFLFVLYLWVILGNGFRYGTRYLYISLLVGVAGFSVAISDGAYWQDPQHQPFGLSLLVLLITIPAYSAFLITKLHAALASAKQANAAKSRFLASMSHELRTPLNGVLGAADLLRETQLDRQQTDFVRIMRTSAHSLLGLIDNVLDIAKIEAGKILIRKQTFDLYQLVQNTMTMLAPMGQAKQLQISWHIDPNVAFMVKGDPQHLRQVLINLIGNGIKFTDAGSVRLQLTAVPPVINSKQPRIRFEIIDTGIGIPETAQQHVFNDFTQVTSAGENLQNGTGLGTTIAKELVQLMSGEIGLHSKPGEGTVFWFEIPLNSVHADKTQLAGTTMLILSSEATHQQLKPQLTDWQVTYRHVTTTAQAFAELMQYAGSDTACDTLMVEQHAMQGIEPAQFASMIHSEPALSDLSLILMRPSQTSRQDPLLRQHYVCIIHDFQHKPQLFNAIHAARSGQHDHEDKVIPLARHYAEQSYARPLNILIAEDNRVNHQILSGILNRAGHHTRVAESGGQALDILTDSLPDFDLLIVDMNMPDYSGTQVIKTMRFMDTSRHLPVIVLTADATPEARQRSLNGGADRHLTKPIDPRLLLVALAELTAPQNPDNHQQTTRRNNTAESSSVVWLDQTVFRELARLGNSPHFLQNLLTGFTEDGQRHLHNIRQANPDNYLQLRESLHALKGAAAEIGASQLTELCRQCEQTKAHQMGSGDVTALINDIELAFNNTLQALQHTTTELMQHNDRQDFNHAP